MVRAMDFLHSLLVLLHLVGFADGDCVCLSRGDKGSSVEPDRRQEGSSLHVSFLRGV